MKTEREIELEKIVSELTRKLAEQQAMFHVNMLRAWPEKSHDEIAATINSKGGAEELNKLLFEAREEGRKEVVPDVDWLANVIRAVDGAHTLGAGALAEKIIEAMLAAAPSPALNAKGGGE